ncbi:MAG: hypothetical protein OHK0024_20840 [Thalassobaculales bacterium]
MRILASLAGLLLAAACASAPLPPPRFAEIGFADRPAFTLAVAGIDVRQAVSRDGAFESRLPADPLKVALRWPQDRLRAAGGGDHRAVFVVRDARVVEEPLPRTTGITGAFTRDQSERYTATAEVVLEIRNARNFKDGEAAARVQRTTTVREDVTPNQRDQLLYELVERLMKDLDAELDRNIRLYLGRFQG